MSPKRQDENEPAVVTKTRPKAKPKLAKPKLYKVLLHNDDYTPMEFVVLVLLQIFNKSESDATSIMLHAHTHGYAVAGVYTFEVAETKVHLVEQLARQNEYPLRLSMEPEDDGADA